jgi:colanic acid/amylovoran biosynthesis glycosyltransferase
VRARIVGDGPLRSALQQRAHEAGVGGRIEFAGSLAPAGVRAVLEAADVLAMPCVVAPDGDRDSMPVVVKEAMAMELLVVASDEVGLPECVLAPWGVLCPPGDAAALASALRQALALSPEERRQAGRAGREWVCRNADVDSETARLGAAIGAGALTTVLTRGGD